MVWMDHSLFNHLPIEGNMGWFQFLAVSICVWVFVWKLWCWEGLGAGGEGDRRGWDGWMASLTQWTWVRVNSGSWRWTGRPGVLRFMGSQRVGHDWATELNWTEVSCLWDQSLLGHLLDCVVIQCVVFKEPAKLFLREAVPFYILTAVDGWASFSLHSINI